MLGLNWITVLRFGILSKGHVESLERVQRFFTKRIPGLSNVPYEHRLKILNILSLEDRRKMFDLVMVYKMLKGLVNVNFSEFFSVTKFSHTGGHKLWLVRSHNRTNLRAHFFSQRVIPMWNELPECVVYSPNLTIFKNRLKRY